MPVGYIVREKPTEINEMEAQLTAEWRLPNVDTAATFLGDAPVLIEDEQPIRFGTGQKPIHIYVVWDRWQDLSQQERSEIVMDAYEATHPLDDIVRVTLAMGLTKGEARKMGLRYEVAPAHAGAS